METANELNIPIIVLAQLNRQLELRAIDNRRPILSDLRGSGEIEQHGDIITFIYRDTVYNDKADHEAAELIIAKNRDGATKAVNVRFIEDTASFVDLKDDGSHLTVIK